MKLNILSDTNSESRVAEALAALPVLELRNYVAEQDYGEGLSCLLIGIICRNPELQFRPRVRFTRKDKTLSMDVMLHLPDMMALDDLGRTRAIAQRLSDQVPAVISKYEIQDFDDARFLADFEKWIQLTGYVPERGDGNAQRQ
jgi:hypothetical protein